MRCLIRSVVKRGRESLEYRDSEVAADNVTIGWAADQAITLPGPDVDAHHARIRRRRIGGLEIQSLGSTQVRVNGSPTDAAPLRPGDVIEIAAHRLSVLEQQPGFDLALLVEAGKVDDAALLAAAGYGRKQAASGWLTKSRLAWILTLGVLLITLAIPVAGLLSEPLRQALRDSGLLPSDALWDPGPLAAAHQTPDIGNNCTVCHRQPFRQVQNSACHECHRDMQHHVSEDSRFSAQLSERQCTSCHKEHKEPGRIVRRDQALCVECHADADAMRADHAELLPVGDFGSDHPQFRLSLWEPQTLPTGTVWSRRKVDIETAGLQEQSNLKFNHKVHLDPQGVDAAGGREVMECGDCHAEDAAGALMQPLTMAGQCRNCHSLYFDENAPDREVPHGDVREVIATLEDYYSKLGLESNPEITRSNARARMARRPGRENDNAEPTTVLAWARRQARLAGEDLLERTVCNSCHEVERNEDQTAEIPWKVQPVKLNQSWMPASVFSHRAHRTTECSDCHQAETSEKSTDVLMPDIDICRDCHGGAASQAKLGSRCVDCHDFHNREMGPLYVEHHVAGAPFSESPIGEASGP